MRVVDLCGRVGRMRQASKLEWLSMTLYCIENEIADDSHHDSDGKHEHTIFDDVI